MFNDHHNYSDDEDNDNDSYNENGDDDDDDDEIEVCVAYPNNSDVRETSLHASSNLSCL